MAFAVRKLTCATALVAMLTAAPLVAQVIGADWDADADGLLSESEFSDGFADRGIFDAWDANGDGLLMSDEFPDGWREAGTFGEFDIDVDGALSEDEFASGVLGRYDADGSGVIGEPELTDIARDMGDGGFWDV